MKPIERSPGVYKNPNIEVLFRTLYGDDIRLAVNPAQRLVDVQKAVAEKCGSDFPEKVARLVKPNGDAITDLLDFPFDDCQEGDVFNVVFNTRGQHELLPAARRIAGKKWSFLLRHAFVIFNAS
eukprot:6323545-Karenia_brevis.AAC.1